MSLAEAKRNLGAKVIAEYNFSWVMLRGAVKRGFLSKGDAFPLKRTENQLCM